MNVAKIAVASGKGGTGKSTVAANLGYSLAQERDVVLVDCDVEEPNLHLFFQDGRSESPVTTPVPVIDTSACTFCGRCAEQCRYGALLVLENDIRFFRELCHSCGGCSLVCPTGAVREEMEAVGRVWESRPFPHLRLISGVLDVGEIHSTRVIQAAKQAAEPAGLIIYDAPPGTACPVVETMEDSDFCLLVTESTPFGLHDLELAAAVAKKLCVPAGVVINRSDGDDAETMAVCSRHDLPVLLRIPFDRKIAAWQNRGELFAVHMPQWQGRFTDLYTRIQDIAGGSR
ncbi:MAG: ATP-binding protein [Methanomicrobiales archaeon]|nr:ATP-binding protein [Methanomicrobiales archaeon]MDI6875927.1 ATP-binding protein [Methanomicrobiales archaeon]